MATERIITSPDDWDRELGIGVDDSLTFDDRGEVSSDTKNKIDELAGSANPAPPKIGAAAKAEELPEDLSELKEATKLDWGKPGEDTTNYGELLKTKYGIEQDGEVTKEDFESQVNALYFEDEYLKQFNLAAVQEVIDGKVPKDTLIKSAIESNLRSAKIFTPRLFDEQLGEYINEGQITPEGEKLYNEIIEGHKTTLEKWKSDAKKHAENQVKDIADLNKVRQEMAMSYKPFGIEMPEEWKQHVQHFIRSGELYNFLNGADTKEEHAKRELAMAIAASPKALAELLNKVFEKGVKHGVATKAKSLFS